MKRIISLIISVSVILSTLLLNVSPVYANECSTDGITTTNVTITNQYMMNGGLQTDSNLLYKAIPRRIYTNCSSYTSEKNYIKFAKNTGTDGVNAYTFAGNNTEIGTKFASFIELTNGKIDIITDNNLNLDNGIWSRSNESQHLGLEYDLGGEVTLDKFYVCWTNQSQTGYERICRGYEIYTALTLDNLYSEDSLIYSVNDNENGINVVTFPENTIGRYFAIIITKCDNGVPTTSLYPRCKEIALTGVRSSKNYAIHSGVPITVPIGSDSMDYWMDGASTSDPENIIKGIAPVSTTYTDANGITPVSHMNFKYFTDGYFNDTYVTGTGQTAFFQGDTYMNDNTYADIIWNLGESKGFWEAWLAFRTEIDGNCFYATKYQLYAGNDQSTIFDNDPIITVDGNAQNVNKITFNKRTAQYIGLRIIVPNSDIPYGAANLRMSIMEFSLLGDAKRTVDVSSQDSTGNELKIEIDGATTEDYIGQSVELKVPSRATIGNSAYVFQNFTVDGVAVDSTLDGDYYKLSVEIAKERKVIAIYKQSYLVSYNALIVKGGTSETIADIKDPEPMLSGENCDIVSELIITRDNVEYKLSSWDINGEVISATDSGEYSYEISGNTTVTAIYTSGGNNEYLAIFTDNDNNQLGIYSIPKDTAVSEIVTDVILNGLCSSKVFGYKFLGDWSQSLDTAYNTTVHFMPIYSQDSKTYDVVINGEITKAKFDEKINLQAKSKNFSSWVDGDSVVSSSKETSIYSPGNITLTENTFGGGTEVADYSTVINTSSWDITDETYTATVTANINGITEENFVGCGVLFTSVSTVILKGNDWDNEFGLGKENVIHKELKTYPKDGCYMISLENIGVNKKRFARAYVKHIVNGNVVTTYSKTIIKLSLEGNNMPEQRKTNAITKYSTHPLLPLYGDNAIPYYNAEFAALTVNGSNDGNGNKTDNNPTISPFLVEGSKKCVIIFPGGGYFQRSDNGEGIDVAKEYNKNGISAFVVRYRIGNNRAPNAGYNLDAILSDGQRAVQYVRYNAKEFGIDPDKIAVCGFSAGGHLSMMVSQNEHEANVVGDRIGEISNIPNATILSYAVTTLLTGTFSTMPPILSGGNSSIQSEINNKYSGQLHVTAETAPTFIWYGEADVAVSPQYNSEAYYSALQSAGVYCEKYSYAGIGHGVGLNAGSGNTAWHTRSVNFLNNILK